MASFLSDAYDLFWDERWWFGSKINGTKYGWKDLENTPGSDVYFPKSVDLHGAILLGVFIVVLRYFLDKYVIYPLGYYLGIKRKRPLNLPTIPALETLYKHKVKPDSRVLQKTWLWETGNFFPGWPKQHVVPELYYYYQMELGFYWGLIFTLCFDHRRFYMLQLSGISVKIKDIRSDFENDSDFEKKSCNVHTTNDCNGNAHDPCSNGNVHS
ncbi:CERS2-like protein [Mya arenaria]|uniref:CERS2-like protein n=1 Tax=Mya arenaria TaxID=6604 RepID=A0ABY7ECS9_MYAAR|nr:CERS2-like protein [Mya arenaria]